MYPVVTAQAPSLPSCDLQSSGGPLQILKHLVLAEWGESIFHDFLQWAEIHKGRTEIKLILFCT